MAESSNKDIIYKEETALRLLSRLQSRPSLLNLEPKLFSEGLKPYEVVEISGEHSTGKTLLLMELIKAAILPKEYNDYVLNGMDADVILLNTDHHFNILKLALLMKNYIIKHLNQVKTLSESEVENIVKNALKNLNVINCFESDSLLMSFHVVKKLLCENTRISLILIDSICAFYWIDSIRGGIRKMDLYVINIVKTLSRCINSFNVSVIFTRPKFFQTINNPSASLSSNMDLKNINVSIQLKRRTDSDNCYLAEVRKQTSVEIKYYTITDEGIKWL